MKAPSSDIAFTPAVKSVQERMGSRKMQERIENDGGFSVELTESIIQFIAARDSFYLATASAAGQPYIQHRGGPAGFLKVLDPRTLAFADFSGNRQYISVGNLSENERTQIFLMDYVNKTRVKIWGRAEVIEDDPDLLERLSEDGYRAKIERAIVFHVEAWDINCPQHIRRRFTEENVTAYTERLEARIKVLEQEVISLEQENSAASPRPPSNVQESQ